MDLVSHTPSSFVMKPSAILSLTLCKQNSDGGNSFDNGPAPPPQPYTPPPPGRSHTNRPHAGSGTPTARGSNGEPSHSNKGWTIGAIVGIILGSIVIALVLLLALAFCIRKRKRKDTGARTPRSRLSVEKNNGRFSFPCSCFAQISFFFFNI